MEYWQYNNQKIKELKHIYNRISKQTQNKLQEIFNGCNIDFEHLYNIADNKTKNKINIYIEEWRDKGLLTGYFGMLAKNIYNRTRVKNNEILELLIYSAYIEEQSKLEETELNTFKDVANYYYKLGQEEVNNALPKKKRKKVSVIPDAIFLSLLNVPNAKGYIWKQYIELIVKYNADQIYRQMTIDLQQQKELDITNDIYQNIIKRQQNSKLSIKDDKISGNIDLTLIGINNMAKIEGIKTLNKNAKVRFIAVEDNVTTRMCHSLDNQTFYIDKGNIFNRYYGETQNDLKIQRIKCKGLVLGLNLPPISHHFHWCRSTITYNPQYFDKMKFEQEKYTNKKEIMNWQEKNETFKCKKIKPILHKDKSRSYRINKYQNKIMELYKDNGNENMCLLDIDTGELIGNVTEGKYRTTVGLDTKTMFSLKIRKKNSSIAIHNHPENYSFSLTDILSYNKIKQIDTMILLTDDYKYYLKSNVSKQYAKEELIQTYKTIEKEIKKKYNNLNGVEKRDLVNQKFFKKVGWIYEKEKN
ncbi:MAG: hypothetical protein HFJ59_04710 [Clostridia bacterium]|nr:hypothetical protein [Clostridia bacterium]